MQALAQITDVNVSGPNFSGTLVSTGIKYKSTDTGLISVVFWFFLFAIFLYVQILLMIAIRRVIPYVQPLSTLTLLDSQAKTSFFVCFAGMNLYNLEKSFLEEAVLFKQETFVNA